MSKVHGVHSRDILEKTGRRRATDMRAHDSQHGGSSHGRPERLTCCVQLAERCSRRYRARKRQKSIADLTHPAANALITHTLCLPRAKWISKLLLEWGKPCNHHPAQGLTAGWCGSTCCGMYPATPGMLYTATRVLSRCPICDGGQCRQRARSDLANFAVGRESPLGAHMARDGA